jgi:hypothetical protein
MLENATAMTPIGEKHVDTHYHFVREVMFDKFVKIVFFSFDQKKTSQIIICLQTNVSSNRL